MDITPPAEKENQPNLSSPLKEEKLNAIEFDYTQSNMDITPATDSTQSNMDITSTEKEPEPYLSLSIREDRLDFEEDNQSSPLREEKLDSSGPSSSRETVVTVRRIEFKIESLKKVIDTPPQLLAVWAGQKSCCVYRPPQSFLEAHTPSYLPNTVAIGPFHHDYGPLQMIEQYKPKYLQALMVRRNLTLEDFINAIEPLEPQIKEAYSEEFNMDSFMLVQMMILDGCFILELFRKACGILPSEDDPLMSMLYIFQSILKDLVKMENQIPWFILEKLFELTKDTDNEDPSLSSMALSTFNYSLQRFPNTSSIQIEDAFTGMHLLDFLRQSFITDELKDHGGKPTSNVIQPNVIQSISQLRKVGITVKPVQEESSSFLHVKFRNGTLEMPPLMIDNFVSCLIFNGVAFEQCHHQSSKHFSTYVTLLDCLVNTSQDVKYLTDQNIIQKYSGTEDEVAKLFNNMGKGLMLNIKTCYLKKLFKQVNHYQKNSWHMQKAKLINKYFDSPWSAFSLLAAIVLLILTVLQTIFTMLGYLHPPG